MTQTATPNIPTHDVFHVVGEKEKARWTKIGVGWKHGDDDGLTIVLNYSPLSEGRTVVRKVKEKEAVADT